MGNSLNIVSKFSAMHGGNITVRVGDYFLARLVAGCAQDLEIIENPDEIETSIIYGLRKICKPVNAFYNCCNNLEDNVDTISFVADKSFDKYHQGRGYSFKCPNGIAGKMGIVTSPKNGTVKLVIMVPELSMIGDYTKPDQIRWFLSYKYTGQQNIYRMVEYTMLGLRIAVSDFMKNEETIAIIEHCRKNVLATENKFMYAYCPKELQALTCEDLKLGIAPHRITKGKDGYNIAIFYPSRKKFIKWCKEKIKLEDDLIPLQTNLGLDKKIFDTDGKINIDKFKDYRINSFKKYLFEK